MHRLEALLAALEQHADQVDHHVGAAHRGLDRGRIAQIRLHRVDLPDPSERLQVAGEIRPAHRRADPVALARQRPHQVAAEEARAPEHGDQRFGGISVMGAAFGGDEAKRIGPYSGGGPSLKR